MLEAGGVTRRGFGAPGGMLWEVWNFNDFGGILGVGPRHRRGLEARKFSILWHPVVPCVALWRPVAADWTPLNKIGAAWKPGAWKPGSL